MAESENQIGEELPPLALDLERDVGGAMGAKKRKKLARQSSAEMEKRQCDVCNACEKRGALCVCPDHVRRLSSHDAARYCPCDMSCPGAEASFHACHEAVAPEFFSLLLQCFVMHVLSLGAPDAFAIQFSL